jgi:prepilin-type N-terminal cleavage/methylation domain-containing protein
LEAARVDCNFTGTRNAPALAKPSSGSGFTLIELAFVLVIIGLLLGLGAELLPMLVKQSKLKEDRLLVKETKTAIIGYALATGRLPYASTTINGSETTGILNGYLPWATLGIAGKDAYLSTLSYAVDSYLTSTTSVAQFKAHLGELINGTHAPDLFCDSGNLRVAFVVISGAENMRSDAPNDDNGDGIITMIDNNQFASPSATPTATYNDILETASLTYLYGLFP